MKTNPSKRINSAKKPLTFFALFTLLPILSFSQTWEYLSSLPGPGRNHPITFSIDGLGYVISGSNQTPDFYSYDPATDNWTQLDNFPGAGRGFSYGVVDNGKAYVGFGFNNFLGYLDDLWEYDPATDTWTQLASCPCLNRIHPAMVAVNGFIYVGLGGGENGNLGDWWEYDIANDSWSQKANFPDFQRHHPYYFGIDDFVYVGLGHGTIPVNGWDVYNDFFRYDPATDTWLELNNFPGEGRVAGTQFSHEGRGYVLSGQGEDHLHLDYGEFYEYDPVSDSWFELNPHPGSARWAPGSFVIDDFIYLTSGEILLDGIPLGQDSNELLRADIPSPAVNVNELHATTAFTSYPNPANEQININLTHGVIDQKGLISMQNAAGQTVLEQSISQNGNLNLNLNVSELPVGIYFVKLWDQNTLIATQKVSIIR